MPEYLDIVNENDEVIGRDTRANIHTQHLIHRGIHVFVLNSKHEILIQKRAADRDYYPSYYDASVGAQVKSGETYEQSARREMQEELGFQPKKLINICDYHSYSDRQRENRRLFTYIHNGIIKFDRKEVESIQWLSVNKIQAMIDKGEKFTEGFKISFQNYLHYLNNK